jgi:hypothetical protein
MSCVKRLYTRHGPPQLIVLWRNLREYSMRQLPCRLIELIWIFVMMSLQLILQRISSFNILRMSPSVMIPITLSCSITCNT